MRSILFVGLPATGLLFTDHGLVRDVTESGADTGATTCLPFVPLIVVPLVALGF